LAFGTSDPENYGTSCHIGHFPVLSVKWLLNRETSVSALAFCTIYVAVGIVIPQTVTCLAFVLVFQFSFYFSVINASYSAITFI